MMSVALVLALQAAVAAAPTSAALVGLDEPAAKARLGEPDVARREAGGALWTYRKSDCVLLVYLVERPGDGLRVTGAQSGPRKAGETPPPVDVCLGRPKA